MRIAPLVILSAAVLVGLVGCGDTDESTDAGTKRDSGVQADAGKTTTDSGVIGARDSGTTLADAGTIAPVDAGTTAPLDAGAPPDAGPTTQSDSGVTSFDAGQPSDAGSTPFDAGTSPFDAGAPIDAGTSPFDAGAPVDAGTSTPIFNNCTEAKFTDRTGLPTTTVTFPGNNLTYTPACILVDTGHQVTFSGTFTFHPLSPGTTTNSSAGSPNNPIVLTNTGMSTTAVFTFTTVGDYPYFCTNHGNGGMAGVVRVR